MQRYQTRRQLTGYVWLTIRSFKIQRETFRSFLLLQADLRRVPAVARQDFKLRWISVLFNTSYYEVESDAGASGMMEGWVVRGQHGW